jgi:ABC-2 type transport system ATP-binding protein
MDGIALADNPIAVKSQLGYLPEGAPLYLDMTVLDFLKFCGEIRGMRGAYLRKRLDISIGLLQIEEVLGKRIEALSKGFKRRVGFAQAILHDPAILILDEPTDGLDPNQKFHVRQMIKQLSATKAILNLHPFVGGGGGGMQPCDDYRPRQIGGQRHPVGAV